MWKKNSNKRFVSPSNKFDKVSRSDIWFTMADTIPWKLGTTVDGWNPAPPGMYETL